MQDTKKVAGELLVELEKKGVTFETVDGKLKYKDSKGNFTENSKEKVKKYKEEIIWNKCIKHLTNRNFMI